MIAAVITGLAVGVVLVLLLRAVRGTPGCTCHTDTAEEE